MPKPNQKPDHISQEDWDAVDSPPLTERMLKGMRPVRESMPPEIFAKLTKVRGPQKTPTKEAVSLRLDRDVLDHFRSTGPGWQTKVNDVLRKSAQVATATASKDARIERSAVSGAFTAKAGTSSKAAKVASSGLKNPASLSPKDIKTVSARTLTQAPDRAPGSSKITRGAKRRAKR
jgi:uncharacterized protein (DUF4415 family)